MKGNGNATAYKNILDDCVLQTLLQQTGGSPTNLWSFTFPIIIKICLLGMMKISKAGVSKGQCFYSNRAEATPLLYRNA